MYLYATQWVGLGLWGEHVSYLHENCISYARLQILNHMYTKTAYYAWQQISYHMCVKTAYYMQAKVNVYISIPHDLFLFGILFIRIFMRSGSSFIIIIIVIRKEDKH